MIYFSNKIQILMFRCLDILRYGQKNKNPNVNNFFLPSCVYFSRFLHIFQAEWLDHPSLSHFLYISHLSSARTPHKHIPFFFLTEFAHFVPRRVILALAVAHSTFPLFSPALLCHDPSVMLLRRAQTSTVQLIFSHPFSAEIG